MRINAALVSLSLLFLIGLIVFPLLISTHVPESQIPDDAPSISIPIWEQTILFITAFFIKPLYMTLSLVIVFLFHRRSEKELVAIRRGMIVFYLGELACAVNYLFYQDKNFLMEYWHNYGMVCAFAFFSYAGMEAIDERILHYSKKEKKCALLNLCGSCYKHQKMTCTMLTIFLYMIPALAATAAMPLAAGIKDRFLSGSVFGQTVIFGHAQSDQFVEARLFPMLAILFLLIAFGVLVYRREDGFGIGKILVALGIGPLAFSLMRFICYWGYADHSLWADVWEECTEFLFIIVTLRIAWQVRSLSSRPGNDGASPVSDWIKGEDA